MSIRSFSSWHLPVLALAVSACSFTAHAGERLDAIMQAKVLRVGTPGDYRPFAMKTDGKYTGHDIEVIEAMAKEMGVKVEYVDTSWPKLMEDLKNNRFDVAVGGITRNVGRISQVQMLPGYAPFGKVALVRSADKDQFTKPEDLNRASVRVIKNPGGTNEAYVLQNMADAQISTHEKNAEIPALIAEGKGDVMITETYEALHYSKADPRLHAAYLDKPLTPVNELGFMLLTDDPDYTRVLEFTWDVLGLRGVLQQEHQKWLQ